MLRCLIPRGFYSKHFTIRPSIARPLMPTYHYRFKPAFQQRSRITSTPVKLPAGPHWRNNPEWLEDCDDEFLWAMTGIEQDSNGIVNPLLYYNDGTCSYLVEYPTGSCQYYIFNSITSEIFKIKEPTLLDDIVVELGKVTREVRKPTWEGIKMESIPGRS
ncbi:MAG: hypothetical protein L6R42_008720 [Xanthoria sp. 1 TBL-2021]|nr:MAG: hypothetical protein L6R42_008720 [Xanthoria sp. 1 TBL-2021]